MLIDAQDDRAAEDEESIIPLGKAEIEALKVNSHLLIAGAPVHIWDVAHLKPRPLGIKAIAAEAIERRL